MQFLLMASILMMFTYFFFGFTQVAEKLMIMHEECLDCNFKSIESLREANHRRVAVPHVREVSSIPQP